MTQKATETDHAQEVQEAMSHHILKVREEGTAMGERTLPCSFVRVGQKAPGIQLSMLRWALAEAHGFALSHPNGCSTTFY